MSFDRARVPTWATYADQTGLELVGKAKWKNVLCPFHSDTTPSLRVNSESGGWVCMSCGVHGGDVLAFHQQRNGLTFQAAAAELGCWDAGTNLRNQKALPPFSARDALEVLERESLLVWVAAANVKNGVVLTDVDRARLGLAAERIDKIRRAFYAPR